MAEPSSQTPSSPNITPKEELDTQERPESPNPAQSFFLTAISEAFTRAPNQYVEYLVGFWYTAKTLEGSMIWVFTPTGGIRGEIGFSSIGYNGEIEATGTLKKSRLPPKWRLLMAQIIQCLGAPTHVVAEMHKEAQQVAGATKYLVATSEEGTHPQLSSDQIKSARDRSAFFTPDSLQYEPIIVSNESEEDETKKDEDTHAASHDVPEDTLVLHPPSP
ncbi:hypothetical protein Tco_0788702 [Tanacetum coccineum]